MIRELWNESVMRNRWYDNDPTMAMAISLLQNTTPVHQEMAARYVLKWMEHEGILNAYEMSPNHMFFMFPLVRRNALNVHARQLLEVLKRLPRNTQIEVSLHMINYIYMLDSGAPLTPEEEFIMHTMNAELKQVGQE